jgi:ribose 5-phosphate isomerase
VVGTENAAAPVMDGTALGLGSGSTAEMILPVLGVRVREGLKITGVPASVRTAERVGAWSTNLRRFDRTSLQRAVAGPRETQRWNADFSLRCFP